MNIFRITLFAVILGAFLFSPLFAQDDPQPSTEAVSQNEGSGISPSLANEDKMIEKALTGYNSEDYKTFYADFAKSMSAIATEQAFQTLYMNMYKKDYGKYLSRKWLKEQSSISDTSPVALLMFSAQFEKKPDAKIAVNLTKEDNAWKIMQIQFSKQ